MQGSMYSDETNAIFDDEQKSIQMATSHNDEDVDNTPRWRLVIISVVHLN